jgi:hypothetical protein
MGLIYNRERTGLLRYRSGTRFADGTSRQWARQRIEDNAEAFGQYTSQPQGYQSAAVALVPTIKTSSNMAAILRGAATFSGSMTATGNMTATLEGTGSVTAGANAAWNANATLAGEGTLTPGLTSVGWMSANLDAGARPSAFDIAQEVLGSVIDSGVNLGDVLRILVAVAAGKTTVTDLGAGAATVEFKNLGDEKTVITATMAGSERTNLVLDP